MPTKSKSQPTLPVEWQGAKKVSEGIYRLPSEREGYRYGFVFPDGTRCSFYSPNPLNLRSLRLLYDAERKGREDQKRSFMSASVFEGKQQQRWKKFERMGLLLEREEEAGLID